MGVPEGVLGSQGVLGVIRRNLEAPEGHWGGWGCLEASWEQFWGALGDPRGHWGPWGALGVPGGCWGVLGVLPRLGEGLPA